MFCGEFELLTVIQAVVYAVNGVEKGCWTHFQAAHIRVCSGVHIGRARAETTLILANPLAGISKLRAALVYAKIGMLDKQGGAGQRADAVQTDENASLNARIFSLNDS